MIIIIAISEERSLAVLVGITSDAYWNLGKR
jgi:hypothetical protein